MKYVYLVYDDWHGLRYICGNPESATKIVKKEAFSGGLPEDTPLDYEGEVRWGWDGVAWWVREEVIE